MLRHWLALIGAVIPLLLFCVAAGVPQNVPVSVLSCAVGANAEERPAMMVSFRNDGPDDLKQIIWHAHFGSAWIAFTDNGDFASGATYRNVLSWKRGLAPGHYSTDLSDCTIGAISTNSRDRVEAPDSEAYFVPTIAPDATPLPASYDNPSHNPIGVISCWLSVNRGRTHGLGRKTGSGLLGVRFRNLTPKPIDRIVFRAAYLGDGGFDFIDAGSFAPNAVSSTNQLRYFLGQRVAGQLLRELPTSTPVDYYGATNCVAVSAHFGDGTTWENPDVSPSEPPLPTAPPTIPPN